MFGNAKSGMPRAQGQERRHQLVKLIETFNGEFDHLHQLAALFLGIACEQDLKIRLELEQAAKEQARSYITSGFHLLEAGLH
jgi:hypothetical protein